MIKVINFFSPNLTILLSVFLTVCFVMVELSYAFSVFKDPGYVSEGIQTLTADEQDERKDTTFTILDKVKHIFS